MFSSYKKIFLLGFIIVILVAIPFSVYIAQKRQNLSSSAAKSTILSFEPASASIKIGDTVTLGIALDPSAGSSTNQVSFVKLSISYDSSKFTTVTDSLKANPDSPNTLIEPVEDAKYESGKASIALSIGADPTKAVKTKTKIAILKLKSTAETTPTSPNITFDSSNTQVLSIASSDQTSENVLSTTSPATVTVTSATTTPTPTSSTAPTTTAGPYPTSYPTFVPYPTSEPVGLAPVCSDLEINGSTNGIAPYSLTFTATGSDSDGTISKISFNFGDSIEDLTAGGGIGTSSVSGQLMHAYITPGIYTAYATLTDNSNNVSTQQNSCTKTITVNSQIGGLPQPTIPPSGDGKTMVGLGVAGIILTIIGGVLLLL